MTKLALHNPELVAVGQCPPGSGSWRASCNPTYFFILLIAGVLGLYVEFTHPGMVLPGVVAASP